VVEGLSRALADAKVRGLFHGIPITRTLVLTHLLFVDDVLIFCNGQRDDVETLSDVLALFSRATCMHINVRKSTLSVSNMSEEETNFYKLHFSFEVKDFDLGLKYLGFQLNPNCYLKSDWSWLIAKMEKRLKQWSHIWLSRAGRLVLVKSVLEAIHVYWMSLAWIPIGILERLHRLCFKYLWEGSQEKVVLPWVRWESLALPKALGGGV
jgi:hypothetical protein